MPLQQIPPSSAESYRVQQRLTGAAVLVARRAWARVDPAAISESWAGPSAALSGLLARFQGEAAQEAADSVPRALADQGVEVEPAYVVKPRAVAGFAGAGYDPVDVFESAPIVTKARIAAGMSPADALLVGGSTLSGIIQTAMADAGRQGQMLGIHSRPKVGYVRMLNPPSCSRCAILAGKPSRREPFARHNRCDCRAIPSMESLYGDVTVGPRDYLESLPTDGDLRERFPDLTIQQRRARGLISQEDVFTKAGARAIRDGADPGQVVNARRGMSSVQSPGTTKWLVTSEGTTRRGVGFAAMDRAGLTEVVSSDNVARRRLTRQRLMPETIYEIARDPEDQLRLLRMYGYV